MNQENWATACKSKGIVSMHILFIIVLYSKKRNIFFRAWEEEYEKATRQNKRPKFYKALLKVFFKSYAIVGFAFMIDEWIIR